MKIRPYAKVALVAIAALMLAACGGGATPVPTATEAPAEAPTAAPPKPTEVPTVAPAGGDAWARIKSSGKLLVGSSLDYPPFDTYNTQFQPDGFDIALITEIGKRLGLQVEVNDFAFEGLPATLELGQVDAAIAAISITPERAEQVDFTTAYFVGSDGVLAATDSTITSIKSPAEMAPYKVGVQSGTVYESWFQNNLIQTGQMPATNLFTYIRLDDAVRDLQQNRIDLVVLNLLPAQTYVSQGAAKLVGRGTTPQNFGIAVRKGSAALLAELNKALAEVQADGTASKLIEQYLKIAPAEQPTPVPTATPAPQPTATPRPAATRPPPQCLDGAKWIADLNLDDRNMTAPPVMQPGQPFSKGWRMQNAGTCDWTPSTVIAYVSGNVPAAQMGGQPVAVGRTVKPGEMIDLWVNLVAPVQPGVYQAFWQMSNAKGVPFGERVWVGIQVPGTPVPTQTPVAGIVFTVDRTVINAGECVNFSWNVQNVNAVYFYPNGADYRQYGVAGQGSQQVCPAQTTTYNLRVDMRDGSTQIRQITITVNPVAGVPTISQFTSNPQNQATAGQCIVFQWQVQGQVDRVAFVRNGAPLWDFAPVSGSTQDCPPAGNYTYELQAFGPGGMVKQQLGMNVVQSGQPPPPTAVPLPTPAP